MTSAEIRPPLTGSFVLPVYGPMGGSTMDVSTSQGHVVPTALAHHGVFYVGKLGTFGPEDQAGDEHVFQVNPNGHLRIETLLEKVLGLAFVGPDGAFYVSNQGFGFPAGQGQVLRITSG